MRRLLALTLSLSLAAPALAADAVPDDLRRRYGAVVTRAEAALRADGPSAAIEIYEDALVAFASGYGRINLRLAQLYQKLGRTAEVAAHFRDCMADDRVDELDREIICKQGFESATVRFEFIGLPNDGRILVLKPELFAGVINAGDRLPKGAIELTVEAPGRLARKAELNLPLKRPWQVMVGLRHRTGDLVPDGFISEPVAAPGLVAEPVAPASGDSHWPVWVTGGAGLALVATGVTLGLSSKSSLDDTRDRQRSGGCDTFCAAELADAQNLATTADALWIGGAVVTVGAVVWWLLDD